MSFKKYLKSKVSEDTPGVAFVFGRNNPPHAGHQTNFDELGKYAKKHKMDAIIFTSLTQNPKKNPLTPGDKLYYLEKMAPSNVQVSKDTSLKTAFQILEDLVKNKGYKRIAFLVGADRENDFQSMKNYAKEWSYGEATLEVVVSGERTEGVSGTDMRNYVKDNDFEKFKENLPKSIKERYAEELFNKVKIGLEK